MKNLNRYAQPALVGVLLGFAAGCSADADPGAGSGNESPTAGGASSGASTNAGGAGGGVSIAGSSSGGSSSGGSSSGGSTSSGGSANAGGGSNAGTGGMIDLPPAMGEPGVWENVSPPNWTMFTDPPGAFGLGNIVVDPARPMDMYVGGYGSIWKSTDYGLTWSMLDCQPNPSTLALGHVLAIAGTTPATLWMATPIGDQKVYKSTDAGLTFTLTGTIPAQTQAFYSIVVDPTDSEHLLTGFHEEDKVAESNDGGETWHFVTGEGWPGGGSSWFPFFVDMGDNATPNKTWFALGAGGSPAMTSDGGAHWTEASGLEGLVHAHGNANLYQNGTDLFVAGIYGPGGGVYKSTDLGENWFNVYSGNEGVVWGTPQNLHVMWAWACDGCTGAAYQTAPQPGTTWTAGGDVVPWGPNSVAVTSDGTHSLFVGAMWHAGLWRYVEP